MVIQKTLLFVASTALLSATRGDDVRITLNTGAKMPMVNLGGTAPSVEPGDHSSNYSEFLRQGGRGLDTALTYTDPLNHQMAAAIKANPGIPRAQLFVTSKVPCCPGIGFCADKEYNRTIDEDMRKNNELLQLQTTDLTLLHHPCDTVEHTIEAWLRMEQALEQGLTSAIGVSNFNADLLGQLIGDPRTNVIPAVNQCNHAIANHNGSHSPQSGGDDLTVQYCQQHGIVYSAYSPLEGLDGADIFKLPEVIAVARAHNVSGAQVALKWLVQQSIPVVTAAHNPEYIAEDLDLFGFELSVAEMAMLASL